MLEFLKKIPQDQTSGLIGSAKSCVLAKLNPDLIISSSSEQALRLREEIKFLSGKEAILFPSLDIVPGEEIKPSPELVGERLAIISMWARREKNLAIAPLKAVMQKTSSKIDRLELKVKKTVERDGLIKSLIDLGYKRMEIVGERGEFSVRGGIIDIFPSNFHNPIRFELSGDEIESLRSFDSQTQRSISDLSVSEILPTFEKFETPVFDYLGAEAVIIIDEPLALSQSKDSLLAEARKFHGETSFLSYEEILRYKPQTITSFISPGEKSDFSPAPQYFGRLDELARDLKGKKEVYIISRHAASLRELTDHPVILGELSAGFACGDILVLTDYEIFGEQKRPIRAKAPAHEGVNEALLADLKLGDYVAHENYGIGIYRGLHKLKEVEGEHLLLEYAAGDKLYVPLTMLGLVEKFSAGEGYRPKLSRLGSQEWIRTRSRVKKSVKDMTRELLELYAQRQKVERPNYPEDDLWQKELEATFPYEETKDQLAAINEVKRDLRSLRPMDRLICGDVGYGKTEVALRAAARAAAAGKQVAILVPTTILAEQHYHNFKERFRPLPFVIEMLSRFKSKAEQKKIASALTAGGVDIVIGTHRLLQKDIKFRDLGLLIIDEEQRFGVAHKERLKQLKRSVDVMTLTATPIPRTLYFSLSGARDMSVINTPPLDRSPIRTYVLQWNEAVIREAVLKELDRGGQIYFVYNRVEKIEGMAQKLKKIVPEAKIIIGHGQMKENKLEETMIRFLNREFDVLLCSTIIESGIDIPTVNTIIIDEADRFGLSQLYQLRGRVGRSAARAYAYLFYHPEEGLTETAIERLKAIQEYSALGSGYKLAMKDLEIRGAGNLLGAEQHGHLLSVGFGMYCELLEEAVREIKGIREPTTRQVEIDIECDAYIPADYIEDERQRIAVYRRMNLLDEGADLSDLKEELKDRFGKIPKTLCHLFEIIELKLYAKKSGVKSIKEKDGQVRIEYFDGRSKSFKKSGIAEIKTRILR